LVVNGPAAVVFRALADAGFRVEAPEFEGQHQYFPKEGWPDNQLAYMAQYRRDLDPLEVLVEVDPQPWGG
jgi:hypothetical protein